jgi:hypothetical protein
MAIQRPGRGTTRVGHAAVPAKGPPQKPTTRVGTGPVPKQSAPPPRGRAAGSSTRSVAKQSSSRPVPKSAPKSNTPMMIAIGAGVVVVLGIAAFAMSGDSKKHEPPAPKATSKPKAVDVGALERDGFRKCDEGLAIIKRCDTQMSSTSLSDAEKSRLKAELEKGTSLIKEGMSMLAEANTKSGNTYPVTQYNEAKKAARMKLGELGGN